MSLDKAANLNNSPYTPKSFMDRIWRNCTKNPSMLKKIEYILKPLTLAANPEAQNSANNISTNLLGKVNEWKKVFGSDYGIQSL